MEEEWNTQVLMQAWENLKYWTTVELGDTERLWQTLRDTEKTLTDSERLWQTLREIQKEDFIYKVL